MKYEKADLIQFERRILRTYEIIVHHSNISHTSNPFAYHMHLVDKPSRERFEIIFYWIPRTKVPKKYQKRQRVFVYYHEIWEIELYDLIAGRITSLYDNATLDLGYMVMSDEEVYELIQ